MLTAGARSAQLQRDAQLLRLLRFAVLVAGFLFVAWTRADPDLWGHLRFGRDIITSRALHTTDPYSFTSDRPWINHEWLAEVLMSAAYSLGGSVGLVALKVLVVATMLACIAASLRDRTWTPAAHDLLLAIALAGTLPRYNVVRPQLFSLLLFSTLLLTLGSADRGRRRVLVMVPLFFAAWANLHGGFLVGLGVLGIWIAVRLVQVPARWRQLTAVGAGSVVATLATPYGIELWRFLAQTVRFGRPHITEWQSPFSLGPPILIPWIVILLTAAAGLWRARGRVEASSAAIVAILAVATAKIARLDAFFAIAVVMLLGPAFGRTQKAADVRLAWPRWAIATAVAVALAATPLFARRGSCIQVPDQLFLDRQAAPVLRAHRGRMLTFFNWGEYAIWHFAPGLKVSMDGRRETVYSPSLVELHHEFYRGASTGLARELKPDVIWLPAAAPVVKPLELEGWHVAFRGPNSVVLTRSVPAAATDATKSVSTGTRCFPGE